MILHCVGEGVDETNAATTECEGLVTGLQRLRR